VPYGTALLGDAVQALRAWQRSRRPSGTQPLPIEGSRIKFALMGLKPQARPEQAPAVEWAESCSSFGTTAKRVLTWRALKGLPHFRDFAPGAFQGAAAFRATDYKPKTQGKPWAKFSSPPGARSFGKVGTPLVPGQRVRRDALPTSFWRSLPRL
jgi:hypothetical protein